MIAEVSVLSVFFISGMYLQVSAVSNRSYMVSRIHGEHACNAMRTHVPALVVVGGNVVVGVVGIVVAMVVVRRRFPVNKDIVYSMTYFHEQSEEQSQH